MGLYLADTIQNLPPAELRRLQKSLRLIYNPRTSIDRLRGAIMRAYDDLGCPLEKIRSMGLDDVFTRLLQAFGTLDASSLSAEDCKKLQQLPYTFWPDESHCFISAEIMDILAEDSNFRKKPFLFNMLRRLSVRERMAWLRWIKLDFEGRSGRDLIAHLYAHLANRSKILLLEIKDTEIPAYLDQIWEDNPMENQISWYYRGILPFFHCLQEEEKSLLKIGNKNSRKYIILSLLKSGQLFIEAEPEVYGQQTRYLLRQIQETQPTQRYLVYHGKEKAPELPEKQGMLF